MFRENREGETYEEDGELQTKRKATREGMKIWVSEVCSVFIIPTMRMVGW